MGDKLWFRVVAARSWLWWHTRARRLIRELDPEDRALLGRHIHTPSRHEAIQLRDWLTSQPRNQALTRLYLYVARLRSGDSPPGLASRLH